MIKPAKRAIRLILASWLVFPINVRIRVVMDEAIPALPRRIRILIIFLLAGCDTTYSDSDVVNPAPENADWAGKAARSLDSPVISRATAPILIIILESKITTRKEIKAIIL
ncbi:hypothetical protein [Methanolobus halotolerans]|uniref:hypothetical protein n=1 Tax=Methanolobus halotolerans TaxID=2052935 RepID=UPI00197C96B4|nr:hypothetical protein [Methanolobus halotolerans]